MLGGVGGGGEKGEGACPSRTIAVLIKRTRSKLGEIVRCVGPERERGGEGSLLQGLHCWRGGVG